MKICFDEVSTTLGIADVSGMCRSMPSPALTIRWDPVIAHPTKGNEQHYDYTDMLGFCAWLNVLVRQSKDCPIACIAQSVNSVGAWHGFADDRSLPCSLDPMGCSARRHTIREPCVGSPDVSLRLFSRLMKDGHVLDMSPSADR